MKWTIFCSALVMLVIYSSSVYAGKKQCQSYRKKLDNIQAQQRQGNSLKRSNTLANRESKARDTWWRCETGKLKVKSKKKKRVVSKKQPSKKIVKTSKVQSIKVASPFSSNKPVVVRSKYQGKKLQDWLAYYQPEKRCARPKSTQVFAACVEDRRRQQAEFEQSYVK